MWSADGLYAPLKIIGQACSTSELGVSWTGSSTLPHLHQEHNEAPPFGGASVGLGGAFLCSTRWLTDDVGRSWGDSLARFARWSLPS